MPVTVRLASIIALCLLPVSASCVQLTVALTATAPVIDGRVSEQEKANAADLEMTRIGGLDKPRYPTKAYVSATLEGIYVGFVATEPELDSLITSTTTENGAVFEDDSVQVLITPSLDTAADDYYHFAVNPNGVRYSNYLISGDVLENWQSAAAKTAQGWEAEFFIPLSTIKAPYELPNWRANFARVRPARGNAPEETSAWVNPGISVHNYKRFGYLTMPRFVPAAPGGGGSNSVTTSTTAAVRQTTVTR